MIFNERKYKDNARGKIHYLQITVANVMTPQDSSEGTFFLQMSTYQAFMPSCLWLSKQIFIFNAHN